MDKLTDIHQFIAFLASELSMDQEEIIAESEFRSLRTWSSLNALIFISRINDEEQVLVTASDLANCTLVSDLYQLILTKKNGVH